MLVPESGEIRDMAKFQPEILRECKSIAKAPSQAGRGVLSGTARGEKSLRCAMSLFIA